MRVGHERKEREFLSARHHILLEWAPSLQPASEARVLKAKIVSRYFSMCQDIFLSVVIQTT